MIPSNPLAVSKSPASTNNKCVGVLSALVVCTLFSGCVKIDTVVKVQQDGSGVITERLQFSKRLLDFGDKAGKELNVAQFLTKEAALRRMGSMGEGMSLVKHEVRDTPDGGRESVGVFKIPDLNNFKYVSPWLAYADYPANNVIRCKLYPIYKSRPYAGARAGEMCVNFVHMKGPRGHAKPKKGEPRPKGPTPQEQQIFRELGPIFRDALKGLHVKFTLESYAPIARSGMGVRNQRAGAKKMDLINFSDKDLDKHGGNFLENEEIMLDLVRWDLGSPDVVRNVKGFAGNHTLPVFLPVGSAHMWWFGGRDIPFKPSRALFDKHFKGKKLDYSQWRAAPASKHVTADFNRIGWKEK